MCQLIDVPTHHNTPEAKELMKRLESKCWDAMMDAESPLYEPALAALVSKKSTKNKKAGYPSPGASMSQGVFAICIKEKHNDINKQRK